MKYIIIVLIILISTIPVKSQWVQISTVPTAQLNAVKFFDANTGIAAGVGGIWRSTNSGVNWTQTLSGGNFNSVSFYDINNGFVVGDSGKIYRTYNGGLNWSPQAIGQVSNNLYGVVFWTSVFCHVVGSNGIIMSTVNGGGNWDYLNWGTSDNYNCVLMNSSGDGYCIGGATHEIVEVTANGGINWYPSLLT